MDFILELLRREPIVSFAILLAVILTVPPLFERLRLPGLVGLLAAGVVLGPYGLHLLNSKSETMTLLSDIGVVYLLFVAGLEIDITQFRKTKYRSMGFGSLTFFLPLIAGTLVGRFFGFGWNAAILMGSLLASHTPLGYPIVSRLGVTANEAVIVTIGGTIFTDIGALLVLAICVGIHGGSFTLGTLLTLLGSLTVYTLVVLFGFDWVGREFFRRSGDDEGNQFLFVLAALFLAAVGAQVIGVEKIVGAFLAGLAVNDAVGEGPVKEKVVFVGSVLFIPIFFVDMGLLIDLPAFVKTLSSIWLMLAIVGSLMVSKFLASLITKWLYRYSWQEMLTMWSLSLPQVAATLAATLVGYRVGLLTEAVLNSVIVLMLVTATVGPFVTARAAVGLSSRKSGAVVVQNPKEDWPPDRHDRPFKVVVPVYNPQTEEYLIEFAALLARHQSGQILPLSIAIAHAHLDATELETDLDQSHHLLDRAVQRSQTLGVTTQPLLRIDDSIAQGISRASREQHASLIVMGWGKRTGLRARLFGNVIDEVLWATHCPVAVTRLLNAPSKIRRILVTIENLTEQAVGIVQVAQVLAAENQAQITLLHVYDPAITDDGLDWLRSQLSLLVTQHIPQGQYQLKMHPGKDIVKVILEVAQGFDLVVLRSERHRTSVGLAMSDITTQVVQQLTCSVVMWGEL